MGQVGAVQVEETSEWGERFGVVAGVTDRTTGSLGFWTDEPVALVWGRWRDWRNALAPRFSSCVTAHQVHGTSVRWHEQLGAGWHVLEAADGHATRQPGLLLAVTVADCVPVYIAAPDARVVALLHGGWRGVAGGILEAGISLVGEQAGARPQNLAVHCGVAICEKCYQVGPEVIGAVQGRPAGGRACLDLRGALAARARARGVTAVSCSPWCTSCHHDRFYSHRASRGGAQRQLGFLGIAAG